MHLKKKKLFYLGLMNLHGRPCLLTSEDLNDSLLNPSQRIAEFLCIRGE